MSKKSTIRKLGVDVKSIQIVNHVKDLWNSDPLYVNVQVHENGTMIVDTAGVKIKKNTNLCMPANLYYEMKKREKRKILSPASKQFTQLFNRYIGQDLTNKSLLIFRTGGLGDLMFSQPICTKLKELYPSCKIIYATAPRYMSIFSAWPAGLIDSVVPIPFSTEILKACDYHLSFEGAIERTVESQKTNAFDVFSKMAGLSIDFKDEKYATKLIPDTDLTSAMRIILPKNYIVFQARSSSIIRNVSESKCREIIYKILDQTEDLSVVFSDSTDNSKLYETFISDTPEKYKSRLVNACDQSVSIYHSISILSLAKLVVGVDSAFSHMASALGVPVIGLFGPFKAELRLKYYKNADWVQPTECTCEKFPCFFHGPEMFKCPNISKGEEIVCMAAIDSNIAVEKTMNILNKLAK